MFDELYLTLSTIVPIIVLIQMIIVGIIGIVTMWIPELETNGQTKYESIVSCIERDIANGTLQADEKLPPMRKLAKRLGITVGTVSRAYDLAEKKGLLRAHVGQGSFVCGSTIRSNRDANNNDEAIDLGINVPPLPDSLELLNSAVKRMGNRNDLSHFFGTAPIAGELRLRHIFAAWIKRRISVDPARLMICSGTQSALVSILSAITQPGDSVLVESTTFPGMLAAADLLKLKLIQIPMDRHGLIPDRLEKIARKNQVLYTIPTQHNPTTATIPASRRKQIAQIAITKNLSVIEDDAYGMLISDGPPPLCTFAPEHVIWMMSLSKNLIEGMRLALVLPPGSLYSPLLNTLRGSTFFAPPFLVELAANWVEEGTADTWIVERRAILARRNAIVDKMLAKEKFFSDSCGTHIWLELPQQWSAVEFQNACLERKVVVFPCDRFVPQNTIATNHIRIAPGAARSDDELKVAISRVGELLKSEPVIRPAVY